MSINYKLRNSYNCKSGNITSSKEISEWLEYFNKNTHVKIEETSINEDSFWFYDDYKGEILNRKRSFFSITGMRYFVDDSFVSEQPIILQNEIGYLGIIAKEFDGVLNFLMQAKIEPGNVNCVQISPTIQATKSNFTRAHGGKLPLYFDWFENTEKNTIIYDQIQSEQGSRFLGKRNRNIIILTDKEVPVYPNYIWMTLGQIKELMRHENLVNMDTRTVLSGIMTHFVNKDEKCINDVVKAYSMLNDYKMYHDVHKTFMPLNELMEWKVNTLGVTNKKQADFCVRYYNIEIQGREVQNWSQPLFKATSNALFVLFTTIDNGVREFLISLSPEIGCFDKVEFGPSIQIPNINHLDANNSLHKTFLNHEKDKKGFITDVILSEEGGRFYHEQNRNVIIEIDKNETDISLNSMWINADSLFALIMNNNVLNIQLRNLISLLNIEEAK